MYKTKENSNVCMYEILSSLILFVRKDDFVGVLRAFKYVNYIA